MRGNLERRLDKLEQATAPEGTIVTVYAWADPADVPPAAHTIIFRRRGQHETDDSTATGSVGGRL